MAGKYEINKATDGQFFFNLKASNGEIILTSEMYVAKAGAANGIDSVKDHSPIDNQYDRRVSTDGRHYFVLEALNHEIIGNSQMYSSAAARETGIESVKTNGPIAEIVDNT